MSKLVAQGKDADGTYYRVVAFGTDRVVEKQDKDALGVPRWTSIIRVSLAQKHRGVDPNHEAQALHAVLHVLDDLAEIGRAVAAAHTY